MRVLFDECVPWPIHHAFTPHACSSAQLRGWAGRRNGALLTSAEAEFDVFVTADQNLNYQQNLTGRRIGVVVVSTNDLRRLRQAVAAIVLAIELVRPGEVRPVIIP